MKQHIIFDLDGTLVDSAPSILESFSQAFSTLGIKPQRPLTPDIIGPPLMQTLALLSGETDQALLQALADQFKQYYDTEGYKSTMVYPEVQHLLEQLNESDTKQYIATNKRHLPTQKIMAHLGWLSLFNGVFALDSFHPSITSKALLLAHVLADNAIDPAQAIYIGDRYEDGLAADHNKLAFTMVTWGYADAASSDAKPHWQQCDHVKDLQSLLIH